MSNIKLIFVLISLCLSLCGQAQTTPDLNGSWTVTIKQPTDDKPVEYSIEANIKQVGTNVIGVFKFELTKIPIEFKQEAMTTNKSQLVNFSGTLANGLLRIVYQNEDSNIPQFGSGLLQVESGKLLTGRFLGFGPETMKIVSGEMIFDRK